MKTRDVVTDELGNHYAVLKIDPYEPPSVWFYLRRLFQRRETKD